MSDPDRGNPNASPKRCYDEIRYRRTRGRTDRLSLIVLVGSVIQKRLATERPLHTHKFAFVRSGSPPPGIARSYMRYR